MLLVPSLVANQLLVVCLYLTEVVSILQSEIFRRVNLTLNRLTLRFSHTSRNIQEECRKHHLISTDEGLF